MRKAGIAKKLGKGNTQKKRKPVDEAWSNRVKFDQKAMPVVEKLKSLAAQLQTAKRAARGPGRNPKIDPEVMRIKEEITQIQGQLERIRKRYGISKGGRLR